MEKQCDRECVIVIESRHIQDGATRDRDGEDTICEIFAIKSVNHDCKGEDAMEKFVFVCAMEKLCE